MTILQMNKEMEDIIEKGIDPETGAINEDVFTALEQMQIDRNTKLESLCNHIKNARAFITACKEEEQRIAKKRKTEENNVERMLSYLELCLGGEEFKSPTATAKYTKSETAEADEDFVKWAKRVRRDLLRFKDPEVDKVALKAALKAGDKIKHASLVTHHKFNVK